MAAVGAMTIRIDTKTEENGLLNRIRIRLTLFASYVGRFSMYRSQGLRCIDSIGVKMNKFENT
jgi:hypothetical protein